MKFKVGDQVWTFSPQDLEVIGPYTIIKVLDDKHPWQYRAAEDKYPTCTTYLREDNCGTLEDAKNFCFQCGREKLEEKYKEAEELIKKLVDIACIKS